jgi:dUTP pyrophosphatase
MPEGKRLQIISRVKIETATKGSAGYDLRADLSETAILEPGDVALVPTGVSLHLDDPNLVAKIYARSGLSIKHGICLANGVGVIDSDYQDEIYVGLANHSSSPFEIEDGMRIAQMLFEIVVHPDFDWVEDFSEETAREGGFGSTGVH